jgi:hypothetical protein
MKKITTIILAVLFTANLIAQVPNYVPTNGLVGWWPFNGNANDESGNGNNGTVNGAILISDRNGNTNSAYNFNSNFIEVSSNSTLNNTNGTVNFWMLSSNSSLIMIPIKKNDYVNAENEQFSFAINHSNLFGLKYNSSCQSNLGWNSSGGNNSVLTDGNWHMVTAAFSTSINIYIDGIQISSVVAPQASADNCDGDIQFGRGWSNFPQYFVGKLDDIGIWNRALTQEEITDLYNSCNKDISISPQTNAVNIGNMATFIANTSAASPSYIWQSDLGQGFQTLNNIGKYSGTSTNTMSISNVQLSNHMDPIRAISVSGNCRDTSNIAYVKITDTCITKINDTIKITKYDTITTKINKYDTIKVMDTLVINATLSGISAPNNTNRIIVYPNPAMDHITIDYGVFSKMSGYTMKITNTLGQTLFLSPINQQSSFINLSSWTGKGVYYLQIIDKQNSIIENRKIILQ